jgi:hypothetical protein
MKWVGVVLAKSGLDGGEMVSRVPAFLHPVAGRPLLWHTVSALATHVPAPETIVLIAPPELTIDIFDGLPVEVQSRSVESILAENGGLWTDPERRYLLADAAASIGPDVLRRLLLADPGVWAGQEGEVAATLMDSDHLLQALRHAAPFQVPNGMISPLGRLPNTPETFVVKSRADLVRTHRRIRDQLVGVLMDAGVTFLLPESVVVDVDVRIGRDSIVYPGVVLEGQTTVGEETVIGPGCRIIDSWVGSGVELKGWDYVAHTSVRNRAILEPNVRRGFD